MLGLMSLTDVGIPCLPINRSWNWNHIEVVKVFHMVSKPVLSVLVAKVNTVVIRTRNYLGCPALSPLLEGRPCSNGQLGLIGVTPCLKNCY